MYKNVPGAVFDGVSGYQIPCDTKVNISMIFGCVGLSELMNAADLTLN